ncbi:1905_t:CDS:2, partial [Gigaspora margarita]
ESYPSIDIKVLPTRVQKLYQEILPIAIKRVESAYIIRATNIISNVGKMKSNMPMIQYNAFEELEPGYYGPKGLNIITSELQKMFVSTNVMTIESCSPQTRHQYLFYVLVPETTIRLIMEDYHCDYEKAKNIMSQSIEFGRESNPLDDI